MTDNLPTPEEILRVHEKIKGEQDVKYTGTMKARQNESSGGT